MSLPVHDVPVNVICGFLGSGKTTAILASFAHRPEGERWAVLVNEFGEVGIDGAVLSGPGGVAVKEIPGGCICCTAGVALRYGLIELLRTVRPDRLFIEPTGLAHPASVLDLLRQPGIRDAVSTRATITVVDPRRLSDSRFSEHDAFQAQVGLADVLVAGFADVTTPEERAGFDAWAAALWPPPVHVGHVAHGALDAAWLDLDPYPRDIGPLHTHAASEAHAGWVFPRDRLFDEEALEAVLQDLLRPDGTLLRLKGLFRTKRGWRLVQGMPGTLSFSPVVWRRDSRVELIAAGADTDWEGIRERLEGARL